MTLSSTKPLPCWSVLVAMSLSIFGCNSAQAGPDPKQNAQASSVGSAQPVSSARYPVTINRPYPNLGMNTGEKDPNGKPARVPCLTCHRVVEAQDKYAHASKLEDFHKNVELSHGGQACRNCHKVPGFDGFASASGEAIAYADVMKLCGQCHAQRLAEYLHGAHGGMNGYWDLTRGPRTRNHCLDCHNSHAPAIPKVTPVQASLPRTSH